MQCFKCERVLSMVPAMPTNPDDAGEFVLSFSYGSRHDQCQDFEGGNWYMGSLMTDTRRHQQLLCADQIRGYVCDDCFEKFAHLLEGWDIQTTRTEGKML